MLRAVVDSPTYEANYYDPRGAQDFWFPVTAPYLKLGAVAGEDGKTLTLFALNRSLDEPMPMQVVTAGFGTLRLREALQLHHTDLRAVNTRDEPDRVTPTVLHEVRIQSESVHATLVPASWTMLRFDTGT